MKIKYVGGALALGALSLVVACSSGGTSGVVPASPASLDASNPAVDDAASVAIPDSLDPSGKSVIVLSPKSLAFTAAGSKKAKRFTADETKYKGKFTVSTTCAKNATIVAKKISGPKGLFVVTPLASASCRITISDKLKHEASLTVVIRIPAATPTPTTAPTATPTTAPTATPTTAPTATPTTHPTATPTTRPTATPTTRPTATPTPAGAAIVNGNFATGALSPGWKACSFSHAGYPAPINASPAPAGAGAQAAGPTAPMSAANLAKYGNLVGTPPPNLNPNHTGALPAGLGTHAALTGDDNSENTGASGICQTFTVGSAAKYLSFWAYEGGSEYNFEYADQEADILDSTGTTIKKTLFAEDNCFWDPGQVGQVGYLNSGCIPASFGGTSSYVDWQGGYWVQRGPYDLSAYAGQSVTLFLGVWDSDTDNTPYPDTYSNEMFVTNVQMSSSSTFPPSFPSAAARR